MDETIKQIQEHLALAQMKLRMLSSEAASAIADKLAALEEPMRKLGTISEGEK
jgi:hypothetical protein